MHQHYKIAYVEKYPPPTIKIVSLVVLNINRPFDRILQIQGLQVVYRRHVGVADRAESTLVFYLKPYPSSVSLWTSLGRLPHLDASILSLPWTHLDHITRPVSSDDLLQELWCSWCLPTSDDWLRELSWDHGLLVTSVPISMSLVVATTWLIYMYHIDGD
jgi:hypothetical protein